MRLEDRFALQQADFHPFFDPRHVVLEFLRDQKVVADCKKTGIGRFPDDLDGLLQVVMGNQRQGVVDGFLFQG